MALGAIDTGIIVFYLLASLALGLWIARREAGDGSDFFVAGRSLGWIAVGSSLFASNISSEHLIGLAADGFRTGLGVGNYEWAASIVLIILATVFVPFYIGSQISTMPEYLERRFGTGAKMYLSILTIVANVLVRISVSLYAGGLVFQSLFGINMWVSIGILSLVTVVYTAAGGLKAVVYTDMFQAAVLIAGTAFLSLTALDQVGGYDALRAALPAGHFDMIRPANDPEMPWVGLVVGVPVLGIWYWCTDQVMVQRVLGAKDQFNGQMGALFAAVLKILPVFLFVLPGLCGRVLYPETDSKEIFAVLLNNLVPIGFKGLVAAALIAALMSSISSTLNSTGTLVSLDLYRHFYPKAGTKSILSVGRWTTLIVMIFGLAWVEVVMRAESLFQYLQQVNAAISPPIAACFLLGVFWKRTNHTGALAGLLGGLVIGVGMLMLELLPFLISAGITFAISIVLIVAGSLLTPPPRAEQLRGLAWGATKISTTSPREQKITAAVSAAVIIIMAMLWYNFS